jgi:hypothetical protein
MRVGWARMAPADGALRGCWRDTVLGDLLQHAIGDHYTPLGTKHVNRPPPRPDPQVDE